MNARDTALIIGLAAMIGAAVSWLWIHEARMSRDVASRSAAPSPLPSFSPPEANAQERRTAPQTAPMPGPITSTVPSRPPASTGPRDDSTYLKVLASASFFPQSKDVIRSISQRHEQFVLTPDSDADWGRRTEQALRDFFQTSSSDGAVQVTSISCRSDACEVQAELRQNLPSPSDDSANIRPGADPAATMHEEQLFGGSLRQEKSVGLSVDRDHIGFVTWYKRMDDRSDTRSP